MSTIATTADAPASRTPQGIAAILLGMLLFVFQDAMMKSLLGDFPIWPLLLVRALANALQSIMPTVEASFAPGNPGVVPEFHEADPPPGS